MHMTRSSLMLLILMLGLVSVAIIGTYIFRTNIQLREADELARHVNTSEIGQASFTDLSGNETDFPRSRADITIVTLWASWSPLSVNDFALLNETASKYNEDQINIILLNRKESLAVAERYLQTQQVPDRATIIFDENDSYYKNIAGYTMPETIIYNRTGETLFHWRGPINNAELQTTLESNL